MKKTIITSGDTINDKSVIIAEAAKTDRQLKADIFSHFNAIQKFKLMFNPAIKVKNEGAHYTWIDDICKFNSSFIVTVSTLEDNCKKNIDNLSSPELIALELRMKSMLPKK